MSKQQTDSEVKATTTLTALRAMRDRIRSTVKSADPDLSHAQCADLINSHPLLHAALFAHFIDETLEDGATLVIWGKEDGLGALLNMKPYSAKAFFNAGSLQELLGCCEAALGDSDFKWGRDRRRRAPRRRSGRQKH